MLAAAGSTVDGRLPCFRDRHALAASPWAAYMTSIYGSNATVAMEAARSFPFCLGSLWTLDAHMLQTLGLAVRTHACGDLRDGLAYDDRTSLYMRAARYAAGSAVHAVASPARLWVHHDWRRALPNHSRVEALHCARGGCMPRSAARAFGLDEDIRWSVTQNVSAGSCIEEIGRWFYLAPVHEARWPPAAVTPIR